MRDKAQNTARTNESVVRRGQTKRKQAEQILSKRFEKQASYLIQQIIGHLSDVEDVWGRHNLEPGWSSLSFYFAFDGFLSCLFLGHSHPYRGHLQRLMLHGELGSSPYSTYLQSSFPSYVPFDELYQLHPLNGP